VIVHTPSSLAEALALKAARPGSRALLGGTDLLAQWQAGAARPDEVIALEPLHELKRLEVSADRAVIGAGVTHHVLAHDAAVRAGWPALAEAALTIGAPAIRNMGTVGGNLANASPAADLPPALLAYDAEVEIASPHATRRVAIAWFFTAYRRIDLGPDELLVAVSVPRPPSGSHSSYQKVGTRAAQSIARVGLAGCLALQDDTVAHVRLAAASVAAVPTRLPPVEAFLLGRPLTAATMAEARALAASSMTPIDDVRATADYRRHALGALVERFLEQVVAPRPR
jgi:CO/xanthine dehydrogenase FAD-binding subunit